MITYDMPRCAIMQYEAHVNLCEFQYDKTAGVPFTNID